MLFRFWKGDRLNVVLDHRGDRSHPLQRLDPGLRLLGLGGLRLEPVDKALQVLAGRVVLGLGLHLQLVVLGLLAFELVVAAAIEGKLLLVEMDDRIDGVVEHVAVVADDDDRVRITPHIILQPERAFEVEIVGRFVEQQQIGFGEEHRGERHAHTPAAGEGRGGPELGFLREAEASENAGGARFGRMGVDIDETHLDVGDPVRIGCGIGLLHQGGAFLVGGENDLQQGILGAGCFLCHLADAGAFWKRDGTGF